MPPAGHGHPLSPQSALYLSPPKSSPWSQQEAWSWEAAGRKGRSWMGWFKEGGERKETMRRKRGGGEGACGESPVTGTCPQRRGWRAHWADKSSEHWDE